MSAHFLYSLWALIAGCMIAAQALVNARLGQYVGGPIWAAFTSFVVGTVLIFTLALLLKGKLPEIQAEHLKWWMFLGGAMGAVFVITSISVVPHLGVLAMAALFITGQLIAATLLDHYGVLAIEARPITLQKLVGICILACGTFLILSKKSFI